MPSIARRARIVEPPDTLSWIAVYSGRECRGHILSRGRTGVEAFDADDKSLGVFPNQAAAINAITSRVAS